jgi:alcohol dehydrogenase
VPPQPHRPRRRHLRDLGLGACLIASASASRAPRYRPQSDLLNDVRPSHPTASTLPAGTAKLPDWAREHTDGEGVDIVIDALGPGAPAESMLEAIDSLARGGVLVDVGGMMERPGLDLFAMMCSQRSVLGSLWFSTREAQDMADMAGSGALDLSVLEHHTFPLAQVNEALDSIPQRHGGFTSFLCIP